MISNAEAMDPKNWILIAEQIPGRTNRECKRRWAQLQRSSDSRSRAPWTKEVYCDIHFSAVSATGFNMISLMMIIQI